MITFNQKGDFSNIEKSLSKMKQGARQEILDKYGRIGVDALSAATPVASGLTAASWYYEIQNGSSGSSITFLNSNLNKGVNIALILQYGHGTGTGGWVQGRDYINPAIKPVFDQLADEVWKEVSNL